MTEETPGIAELLDEWALQFDCKDNDALLRAARKIVDEVFPEASDEQRARAASRIDALAGAWGNTVSSWASESTWR